LEIREEKVFEESNYVERTFYHHISPKTPLQNPDFSINIVKALKLVIYISPYGTSELCCTTTKTDTAERSISIGRKSLQVFFVLGTVAYLQSSPLGGSRDKHGVDRE
jgi:hypothetical protein